MSKQTISSFLCGCFQAPWRVARFSDCHRTSLPVLMDPVKNVGQLFRRLQFLRKQGPVAIAKTSSRSGDTTFRSVERKEEGGFLRFTHEFCLNAVDAIDNILTSHRKLLRSLR
jgi:hypothetical protein